MSRFRRDVGRSGEARLACCSCCMAPSSHRPPPLSRSSSLPRSISSSLPPPGRQPGTTLAVGLAASVALAAIAPSCKAIDEQPHEQPLQAQQFIRECSSSSWQQQQQHQTCEPSFMPMALHYMPAAAWSSERWWLGKVLPALPLSTTHCGPRCWTQQD